MNEDQIKHQIIQSYISLASKILLSFLVVGGIYKIALHLMKYGLIESGRDAFNIALGAIITLVVMTGKYWLERSSDYSDSKNVERANKLNQSTTTP